MEIRKSFAWKRISRDCQREKNASNIACYHSNDPFPTLNTLHANIHSKLASDVQQCFILGCRGY